MNKDSLAKRVYLNTKHILGVGGIIIITGAIYRCSYMNSDEVNNQVYKSETLQSVSGDLIGAIVVAKSDNIPISATDERYLVGYQYLKDCGRVKFGVWDRLWSYPQQRDARYDDYNSLLSKINAVNGSLYTLRSENFLQRDYSLPHSAVWEMSCKYGITPVSQALSKLSVKADLKGLNWTERRARNYDEKVHGAVSLPLLWHVKKNPWRGLDGCIYLANTKPITIQGEGKEVQLSLFGLNGANALHTQLCQMPDMYKQAKVAFPIDKATAKESIIQLRDYQPMAESYFSSFSPLLDSITSVRKDSAHFVNINNNDVPVGFNAQLSINPYMQIATTQVADCFTGKLGIKEAVCQKLNDKIKGTIPNMEAKAVVRQVGIAIVDVPSGRVDVATGSTSSCFDKNYGVAGGDVKCLDIPDAWKKMMSADQAKENPALYTSYMPASTIKPIQALAMVRAFPEGVKANMGNIQDIMARSSTEQVLDILTCSSPISGRYATNCQGFAEMQKAASDIGWNNECHANNSKDCGKQDILYGQKLHNTNMQTPLFYGRLLINDEGELIQGLGDISQSTYNDAVQQLSKLPREHGGYDWRQLKRTPNASLSLAIQESYGQRNARATPLGVASAMRTLLASTNTNELRPTHIVEHLWTAGNDSVLFKTKQAKQQESKGLLDKFFAVQDDLEDGQGQMVRGITPEEAKTVISFFTKAHYAGTAYTACKDTFGACTSNDSKPLGYHIFSKTGTTTFSASNIETHTASCNKLTETSNGRCRLKPISWFVLGVGKEEDKWSKVIVVMAERNWHQSGKIQSDNMAAQIGFGLMRVLHDENLLESIDLKGN